jgi:predicted RNA-binding protein YlxR (DUF448 family)/ribosomal protein L7Ae-like RNA K-turn-binding protein
MHLTKTDPHTPQEPARRTASPKKGSVRRQPLPAALEGRAVRTCVACRKPGARDDELLRLVEGPDGEIAVDARARLGGRGAWVHPTRACITTAAQRHAAERSLKIPVRAVDAAALVDGVAGAYRRKAYSLVLTAGRKGALAQGAQATLEALEKRRVPLLLLAHDAGDTSRGISEEAAGHGDAGGVRVRAFGTKAELGNVLGREELAILAVNDARIAAELVLTIDRLAGLEG